MPHETHPSVYLIARPSLNYDGIRAYLGTVGGEEHFARMVRDNTRGNTASRLIEFMGRLCYRSWSPGLNANVTRVREDRALYILNILNASHGSVLEHAMFSFVFSNVSRVFTHELVRHRAGTAFSQESMRFVRLTDIGFEHPAFIRNNPALLERADNLLAGMEEFQREMAGAMDLDNQLFEQKKIITSAMRRYAPDGLATHIGFSANVRALRWLCEMRTHPSAEEEIRRVFGMVAEIMEREEPELWADFTVTEEGEWVPRNHKV